MSWIGTKFLREFVSNFFIIFCVFFFSDEPLSKKRKRRSDGDKVEFHESQVVMGMDFLVSNLSCFEMHILPLREVDVVRPDSIINI